MCLILAAQVLSGACASARRPPIGGNLLGLGELGSCNVDDAAGALRLAVKDVLVNDHTGEIEYLIVEPGRSSYGLDPHAAPRLESNSVLVPWDVIQIDPAQGCVLWKVGAEAILNAPQTSDPDQTDSNDIRLAQRYWEGIVRKN